MSDSAVVIRHLEKRYGSTVALNDLSLEIQAGEIFGIIGPNGSGKTTTVECVQGLRQADGGEISVFGIDPRTNRSRLRTVIGSQLQESALPERIRVWEALDLFAAISPNPVDWRELVNDWGLKEKWNAAFGDLSGGQRQRLLVALALVNRPRIVFLDEMTTGLDPASRRVAWDLVEEIRRRGSTVVLITHFMDEAEHLCDRLAVVDRGQIIASGTPAELVDAYGGQAAVLFSTESQEIDWLNEVPGVDRIERQGIRVTAHGGGPLLALTAAALVGHGIVPLDLRLAPRSLEDAFLNLTKTRPGIT